MDTLAIGIAADLATAALSIYVAFRVRQAQRWGLEGWWSQWFWYGLASFLVLDGGYALWVTMAEPGAPIPIFVLLLRRLLFVMGVAGLVIFLADCCNGHQARGRIIAWYVALATVVEATTLYQNPIGHQQLPWSIQFVHARPTPPLFNLATALALFGPLVWTSTAGLMRYKQQPGREQRFRLVILHASIISFCVGITLGFWDNDWYWYGLFENRLVVTIVAGMLFALRPPWLVRRIWGIQKVRRVEQWIV